MKTKKNNACPLIKEIEEHDDVSSEKKIRYMESMQMLTYIQQDTNEKRIIIFHSCTLTVSHAEKWSRQRNN